MVPIKNGLFRENWLFGDWLNQVSTVLAHYDYKLCQFLIISKTFLKFNPIFFIFQRWSESKWCDFYPKIPYKSAATHCNLSSWQMVVVADLALSWQSVVRATYPGLAGLSAVQPRRACLPSWPGPRSRVLAIHSVVARYRNSLSQLRLERSLGVRCFKWKKWTKTMWIFYEKKS